MNLDEYEEKPCVVPPSTVGTTCAGTDPRCNDLEWAADHPDTCPNAAAITGLKVVPPAAEVEVGNSVPYRALLTFANGQTKDVTEKTDWSVTDAVVGTIDEFGIATGKNEGVTAVQASYRRLTGFAELDVVARCVQAGLDTVLVFDCSAGMSRVDSSGTTYLDLAKKAALAIVGSSVLTSGKDRIAVVSCHGVYETSGVTPYHSVGQIHMVLSSSRPDILAAIDSVQMGRCYYDIPPSDHGSECASAIGAGLQRAEDELLAHGRPGARAFIVYIGLGYETYCDPDPLPITEEMKGRNWQIAGIGIADPITHTPCSSQAPLGQMSTWDYIKRMVTCGMFYGVPTSDLDKMVDVFAHVVPVLCGKQNDDCVYYIPVSGDPPPVVRYRDQLDYTGWTNWLVISGYVDLIGVDLWPLQPGHGLFVDLVGTDLTHPTDRHAVGKIQTRQIFAFNPGRYRLTCMLAGNQRSAEGDFSVRVEIGSLLSETVTISDWAQDFTLYTWDFSVASGTEAAIVFAHNPLPQGAVKTVGLLLDDVTLTNLDTGIVLFHDDFNSENPV